jgi:hypothetical protein
VFCSLRMGNSLDFDRIFGLYGLSPTNIFFI